ncbi:MAG: protease modulator HflC [candidate division KSB1 bacterium]|nr:protease modulator HflC [candidate division KSB1 bacterium]
MKPANKYYLIGLLVIVALIVISNALYIVDETQQVIITQFGDPVGDPVTSPGLHAKLPFVQKATFFEKRILEWDGDTNQVPTADKKYILVDTFARWHIVDPLKYYQSIYTERNAQSRLDDVIDGITRDFISENNLIEVVRNSNREMRISIEDSTTMTIRPDTLMIERGRVKITENILTEVKKLMPQYGIEVLDIRIKQVNYIDEVRQKVFGRMISERERIAEKYRSEGMGAKSRIQGRMQRELRRIESEAYRTAQQIKGRADAQATEIYADAYSRDADFYAFWQALDNYKTAVDSGTKIILSTESDFLKYLKSTR